MRNGSKPMRNKKKYSPIPWLALHLAIFNDCDSKTALAKARANLADRLYALSQPKLARRGDWRALRQSIRETLV